MALLLRACVGDESCHLDFMSDADDNYTYVGDMM